MSMTRALGLVLLVGGIILFIVGLNASHSVADSLSNWFTGHFTRDTMWYLIGGGAAAVLGLILSVGRR